jgi:hypothetical protein
MASLILLIVYFDSIQIAHQICVCTHISDLQWAGTFLALIMLSVVGCLNVFFVINGRSNIAEACAYDAYW